MVLSDWPLPKKPTHTADNPKIKDYEAFPALQNTNISYKRVEFCAKHME
jgi:hypothetical protein